MGLQEEGLPMPCYYLVLFVSTHFQLVPLIVPPLVIRVWRQKGKSSEFWKGDPSDEP